ncbi:hypothetical protein PGB90_002620 [Kerria lacca]
MRQEKGESSVISTQNVQNYHINCTLLHRSHSKISFESKTKGNAFDRNATFD